ncbi:MAG: 16S rRNA processing protein RimM [Firmicutes bacterium]|nr:16S rRNA processing protein RimM [Bacillota bacterium]
MAERYFVIGKIVNTQGIKGEMRLLPSTDNIERIGELESVFIEKKGKLEEFEIQSTRAHKQFILLKLKGVDDMTSAEKFKNSDVKIPESMSVPCEEDEYYISDLYDMEVFTEDDEYLGILSDIIFTGANDVYVVKDDEKEILIPAIKKCIINVDVKEKKMTVRLMEGLR